MPYSQDALTLRNPSVGDLPRADERISFLYLSEARITQDRTGVVAWWEVDGEQQSMVVPVASLNLLILGHGTSVTSAALSSLHRSGCCVLVAGLTGAVGVALSAPLTSRADWAQAQARVWSDPVLRLQAARRFYQFIVGSDFPEGTPLRMMRGVEGRMVRNLYSSEAARLGLRNWRRKVDGDDSVNPLLNLANSMLYGVAAAAVRTLGLNSALGFIHQGASGALLFDLADAFKIRISIPAAFRSSRDPDPVSALRRRMREAFTQDRVMEQMVRLLVSVLEDHRHAAEHDTLVDEHSFVPGMRNYAGDVQEVTDSVTLGE